METVLLGDCNIESFEEEEQLSQVPEQESIIVYLEKELENVLDEKEYE